MSAVSPIARKFPQLRLIVERRYTRDAQVPVCAGDENLEHGWQSVAIPPSLDQSWRIFDNSRDYKTGWRRIRVAWGAP